MKIGSAIARPLPCRDRAELACQLGTIDRAGRLRRKKLKKILRRLLIDCKDPALLADKIFAWSLIKIGVFRHEAMGRDKVRAGIAVCCKPGCPGRHIGR